jgi:hypothetical protein
LDGIREETNVGWERCYRESTGVYGQQSFGRGRRERRR